MIAGMRAFLIAAMGIGVVVAGPALQAQGLLAKPGVQHASVVATANPAAASPGSLVTLWADVTPNPSIHIYAEGAKDFTPVSLVLTPHAGITAGPGKYPKPGTAPAPRGAGAGSANKQGVRGAQPATRQRTGKTPHAPRNSGAGSQHAP